MVQFLNNLGILRLYFEKIYEGKSLGPDGKVGIPWNLVFSDFSFLGSWWSFLHFF